MPDIFLSPVVKQLYSYPNGGNEREWMNRLADVMQSQLKAGGIRCVRSPKNMGLRAAVELANRSAYDLYLSFGTACAPADAQGMRKGACFRYYEHSPTGKQAALRLMENYKKVYPEPELVSAAAATTFFALRGSAAPAVMISLAYHDNPQDEIWLTGNIEEIGRNLSDSLAEQFPVKVRRGQTA